MQTAQNRFILHSKYQPTGDQPQAIEKLVKGFREGSQLVLFRAVYTRYCGLGGLYGQGNMVWTGQF